MKRIVLILVTGVVVTALSFTAEASRVRNKSIPEREKMADTILLAKVDKVVVTKE